MTELATNVLYYGDNLDILRRYLPDASVDLIYLDPPFNSNRDYTVIFRDESGRTSDAQLRALRLGLIRRCSNPDGRERFLRQTVGRSRGADVEPLRIAVDLL